MRIGLFQFNPTVGAVNDNANAIIDALSTIEADVLVTPELSICGYPPRDLLLDDCFVTSCNQALNAIKEHAGDCAVVVGHPRRDAVTGRLRNSVSVFQHKALIAQCDKQLLPNYDIFDESRYFEPGDTASVFELNGIKVGIAICEDLWQGEDAHAAPTYDLNPIQALKEEGCSLVLSPSASPFVIGKQHKHIDCLIQSATVNQVTIAMCNQVGGCDDLIFDGSSTIVTPNGVIAEVPPFKCGTTVAHLDDEVVQPTIPSDEKACVEALVLGIRDYVNKTNHTQLFLGLSGGIDSALTAALATIAIGSESVTGILMPSRFSSLGSVEDAEELAERLSIQTKTIPIEYLHQAFERTFEETESSCEGLAAENVQARLRGLILMAHANEHRGLLLATGNKSELAVGYSTLYGDMAGALSPIGDVYKSDVWTVSRYLNENYETLGFSCPPIPESSITKAPSAELRPDQRDEDTLPPYDELDEILRLHIDFDLGAEAIGARCDIAQETIDSIVSMVDHSQFKREQSSVILKLTPRAFGRGRRMPIVMKRNWSSSREIV
ncbi:MAG: NAD+ synthase [Planctomycetota bacterium]|nr:NAD+ synthase [Planctomycetota bacterium]